MFDEGKSLVASSGFWLIVTLLFAIALCVLIVWLFSDVELEFAGGDRFDRSVRKQLGTTVLATAALSLIIMLVLVLHVEFFRYWVGAVCYLIAADLLFGALRQFRGIGEDPQVQDRDKMAEELKSLEGKQSEYDKVRLVRSVRRLTQIPAVAALYFYLPGSRYFSLFDFIGFVLLFVSYEARFVVYRAALTRKVATLKTALTKST